MGNVPIIKLTCQADSAQFNGYLHVFKSRITQCLSQSAGFHSGLVQDHHGYKRMGILLPPLRSKEWGISPNHIARIPQHNERNKSFKRGFAGLHSKEKASLTPTLFKLTLVVHNPTWKAYLRQGNNIPLAGSSHLLDTTSTSTLSEDQLGRRRHGIHGSS